MYDSAINYRTSRPVLDGTALDSAIDEARAELAALLRAPGGGEPSRLTEARALLGSLLDRRVALAAARLGPRAAVHAADMARLGGIVGDAALDLIISSLALHYVADLPPLFLEWARVLKPGGILVLSTHHPLYDLERLRQTGYLATALVEEEWAWLGRMRFYQRPLSAITEPMSAAGFVIERLVEPVPQPEFRDADAKNYAHLMRAPSFLMIRARKG